MRQYQLLSCDNTTIVTSSIPDASYTWHIIWCWFHRIIRNNAMSSHIVYVHDNDWLSNIHYYTVNQWIYDDIEGIWLLVSWRHPDSSVLLLKHLLLDLSCRVLNTTSDIHSSCKIRSLNIHTHNNYTVYNFTIAHQRTSKNIAPSKSLFPVNTWIYL